MIKPNNYAAGLAAATAILSICIIPEMIKNGQDNQEGSLPAGSESVDDSSESAKWSDEEKSERDKEDEEAFLQYTNYGNQYNSYPLAIFDALWKENDYKSEAYSPYSMQQALSRIIPACEEESDPMTALSETVGLFESGVESHNTAGKINGIEQANLVVSTPDVTPAVEYLEALNRIGAKYEKKDLSDPDEIASVNQFVSDATHGMIDGILNEPADAVALNVLYMNEMWHISFNESGTKEDEFDGKIMPMMNCTADFNGGKYKGIRILDMKYEDAPLAMRVMIPEDKEDTIRKLWESIEYDEKSALSYGVYPELKNEYYHVSFPKISLNSEHDLTNVLKENGLNEIFESGALQKFDKNLVISNVLQKDAIDITEKGTEAAATTSIGLTTNAIEPEEDYQEPIPFIVDCPFLYSIYNTENPAIYFFGYVQND